MNICKNNLPGTNMNNIQLACFIGFSGLDNICIICMIISETSVL